MSPKERIESTAGAPANGQGSELLTDGQEEVFSRTAVERGMIRDPLAMDPKLTEERGRASDKKDVVGR